MEEATLCCDKDEECLYLWFEDDEENVFCIGLDDVPGLLALIHETWNPTEETVN